MNNIQNFLLNLPKEIQQHIFSFKQANFINSLQTKYHFIDTTVDILIPKIDLFNRRMLDAQRLNDFFEQNGEDQSSNPRVWLTEVPKARSFRGELTHLSLSYPHSNRVEIQLLDLKKAITIVLYALSSSWASEIIGDELNRQILDVFKGQDEMIADDSKLLSSWMMLNWNSNHYAFKYALMSGKEEKAGL